MREGHNPPTASTREVVSQMGSCWTSDHPKRRERRKWQASLSRSQGSLEVGVFTTLILSLLGTSEILANRQQTLLLGARLCSRVTTNTSKKGSANGLSHFEKISGWFLKGVF